MTLFGKLLNDGDVKETQKRIALLSPLSGTLVPLDDFPNSPHQARMYGEGIAIVPSGFKVHAPFNGVVEELPVTCERMRLRASNGIRLQIQFGVHADKMMGQGFRRHVREKQQVRKGDLLLELDLPLLKKKLSSSLCAMTILNSDKLSGIVPSYHQVVSMEDTMMTLVI